jgi:hypothetical protein
MGAPAGVADIVIRSDEHGSRHSRRHRGSRPLIVLSKRLVIDVETNQFEYQCGPAPREIDRRRAPSVGMRYEIVNGTVLIDEGRLQPDRYPGKAIEADSTSSSGTIPSLPVYIPTSGSRA